MGDRDNTVTFLFLAIVFAQHFRNTTQCGDIGTVNPSSHVDTTGTQTDQAFFIESGASACCGTLKNWKFYATSAGTVDVMLWRPTTGSNYELMAQEPFAVTVGLSTPLPTNQLDVEIGDVVGWKTTGLELIPSSATAGSTTQNQLLAGVTVGSEVPWAGAQDTTNTYAFGAVVSPNELPVVNDGSKTISESDTSQSIFTVDVTDADTVDILGTGFTVAMTGDSAFSLEKTLTGYDIKTGSTLVAGTYPLTVTATDRCGDTDTGIITITVTDIAPVFSPNPLLSIHPTSLSDVTTTATSLYAFSVTDNGAVTCTSDNTLFEIRTIGTNNNFELWLKSVGTTGLNYDTASSQAITISCTDGTTTITSTYSVPISDEPPVLTDLGGTSGPISDLSAVGLSIHQFTVTDQDDVISCSVDAPNSARFAVNAVNTVAGTQRFDLVTASTLNHDTAPSYDVGISCSDGQNPDVTGIQTVDLYDEVPTLTGLPFTATAVYDGVQTAAVLGSFSVTDANDQALITCTIAAPNDALFTVTSGIAPAFDVSTRTGVTLTTQTYNLNIQCQDDEAGNVVSGTFAVPVTDRPPEFVGTFPAASGDLSDDTVTAVSLAKFTVSEAVTCSVTNPAGTIYEVRPVNPPATQPEFEIWVKSTVTEASIDYNDQAVPLTLTVTCTDGTSPITGDFDVNIVDASPVLTGLPGVDYDSVGERETADIVVGTFDVTDSDDTITCSVDAGDPSAALFYVQAGTYPQQEIHYNGNSAGLDAEATPSYTIPITCSDGNTDVTGTKTVLISLDPPFVFNPSDGIIPTRPLPLSDATGALNFPLFGVRSRERRDVTCAASALPPNENDFEVVLVTGRYYRVRILDPNNLNYDVNSYVMVDVTCTDTAGASFTQSINVTLFDEDPVLTGLPDTYTSIVDTDTAAALLHTFQVTDSDDVISCDVDPASPEAAWFEVQAGTAPDFEIWFKGAPPAVLDYVNTPSYTLSIVCNDGAVYTITETYTVEVTDAPPQFVNLPASTPSISEDATANTFLFTVTTTDTSELVCYLGDTVTAAGILPLEYNAYTAPYTTYNVYGYHTTGFDFEKNGGTVTVDVTCGDATSTVTDTLTVNIINAAPEILNPAGSATISEAEAGEVPLKKLVLQEFDANDATCTLTNNDGGPFTLTTDRQLKKTTGALDYETKSVYNLRISCTDGSLTTTDTFVVNVENVAPEITNLPTAGSIPEEQVDEVLLYGLETSEDAASCDQVAPVHDEFVVKFEPTTNLWSVYYVSEAVAGRPLNWAANPSYDINIVCSDASGTLGQTKTYTVNVLDNQAPTFTNIAANPVTKVQIQAKTVSATDTVFTVLSNDVEGDDVTYTLVNCTPSASCPFTLSSNGDIIAIQDLHSDPENAYVLTVMAQDKYNTQGDTKQLILELLDRNIAPEFTNLPKRDVIGVEENNAAGDVIFDMNHFDPDTADTLRYVCSFPDGGAAYFSCDETTGEIKVLSSINYEQMTRLEYRVEAYVDDGYAQSPVENLKLRIKDVNEPPAFQNTQWKITKLDEGGPGQQVGCPDFDGDILDEDLNDQHTYTMVCTGDNGVFVMDSATGCVTMTEEWDLDLPGRRLGRQSTYCTVTATDQGGNTTEAQLEIVIRESDDNIPYTRQTSYVVCARQGTSGGGMGQVLVDDNDVLPKHRIHTFSFDDSRFSIDGNGVMSYGDLSNYAVGTSFDTTLRITDEGGNESTTPVTVLICDETMYQQYMSSNSVSSSSSSASGASSSSSTSSSSGIENWLYWLIPALLLLALMAGLLGYLIRRCCLSGRCGPRWMKGGGKLVQGARMGQAGGGMKMRKVTVMRRMVVRGGQQGYRQGVYSVQGGQGQMAALPEPETPQTQPTSAPPRKSVSAPQDNLSKPKTPPKPASPGQIAPLELPITHYYARNVGNLGGANPTV